MSTETSEHDGDDQMPPSVAAAVHRFEPPAPTEPETVERVMRAVRLRRIAIRRRRVAVIVAAMAASLTIGVALWRSPVPTAAGLADQPVVHFRLQAPDAKRLALVGDFNSWDPRATPMMRDTTGAWVASLRLAEGRYLYAFVADGKEWLPDPSAPAGSPDDFSRQNSVLVVTTHFASASIR